MRALKLALNEKVLAVAGEFGKVMLWDIAAVRRGRGPRVRPSQRWVPGPLTEHVDARTQTTPTVLREISLGVDAVYALVMAPSSPVCYASCGNGQISVINIASFQHL